MLSLALGLRGARLPAVQLPARAPAAVFMGDSGSQVLGFTLGALGLATSWKVAETTVATLVLPLLVLAVPILDTGARRDHAHRRGAARSTRAARTTARTGSSAAG